MAKFRVIVQRTEVREHEFQVEAPGEYEATERALEEAANFNFHDAKAISAESHVELCTEEEE